MKQSGPSEAQITGIVSQDWGDGMQGKVDISFKQTTSQDVGLPTNQ